MLRPDTRRLLLWCLAIVAGLALVFAVIVASWIPARRAARVDPAGALRAE